METADNVVFKAVGLNLCPVLNLVAGDVFSIASYIKAGVSVGTIGTDSSHKLIVFIGDSQLGCFVTQAVDYMIDGLAFGFIGSLAIHFELLFNLVEQRFFEFVVLCAELLGTLEHEVFKVVCQTGCFGRVVLTSHANGNVCLDAWCFLVHGHIDLQPIFKGIDACLERIVRHRLVVILS